MPVNKTVVRRRGAGAVEPSLKSAESAPFGLPKRPKIPWRRFVRAVRRRFSRRADRCGGKCAAREYALSHPLQSRRGPNADWSDYRGCVSLPFVSGVRRWHFQSIREFPWKKANKSAIKRGKLIKNWYCIVPWCSVTLTPPPKNRSCGTNPVNQSSQI